MYPQYNEHDPQKRIDLRLEDTYLAMLIGGVPGDAIDLKKAMQAGESQTRLKVDLNDRKIVYENEAYVSGESDVPDTVSLIQIGEALHLNDLGDVSAEVANEGDLLIYQDGEWQSITLESDDLASVIGYNTDGKLVKTDPSDVGGGGGSLGMPIGSTIIWPGAEGTIPSGYVIADGRALNRTVYADLFALIGTTYGAGDGSTTFNIPNTKGRTIVGLNATDTEFNFLGKAAGNKTHNHSLGAGYAQVYIAGGNNTFIRQRFNIPNWVSNMGTNGTAVGNSTFSGAANLGGTTDANHNIQPSMTELYIMRII